MNHAHNAFGGKAGYTVVNVYQVVKSAQAVPDWFNQEHQA